jgi:hypothetical protein
LPASGDQASAFERLFAANGPLMRAWREGR